jgi:hypothetical protein
MRLPTTTANVITNARAMAIKALRIFDLLQVVLLIPHHRCMLAGWVTG